MVYMFDWLAFHKGSRRSAGKYPFVSISPDNQGRVYISVRAMDLIIDHCPKVKAVEIGIDRDKHKLAIVPRDKITPRSISLYQGGSHEETYARVFRSLELMEKITGMVPKSSTRFTTEWNDDIQGLIVDLDNPIIK